MTDRAAQEVEGDTLDAARPESAETTRHPYARDRALPHIAVPIEVPNLADELLDDMHERLAATGYRPQFTDWGSPADELTEMLADLDAMHEHGHLTPDVIAAALDDLWLAERIIEDADAGLCKPLPIDIGDIVLARCFVDEHAGRWPAFECESPAENIALADLAPLVGVSTALDGLPTCQLVAAQDRHRGRAITDGRSLRRIHRRITRRRLATTERRPLPRTRPSITPRPRPNPRRIPIAQNAPPSCTGRYARPLSAAVEAPFSGPWGGRATP